ASADVLATRRFQPLRLARDRAGIAIGGVRTPWVSAPVATLSGLGQRTAGMGIVLGSTRKWTDEALLHRYPGGKPQYLAEFTAATRLAVGAGFLLPDDEPEILALAQVSWPPEVPADPPTRRRPATSRLASAAH
ncbi:MAG TPA: alpha/beta hydrolase domain-containing protein, partial [Nakamurella sp.]